MIEQRAAQRVDVLVLGAGAAGMMCALEAGRRGRRVVLLDHAEKAGKKILISGGGRCNFTNLHCTAGNFLSQNPHFAKSALASFPPSEIVAMVERGGIRYHEKTLGQLFCDGSAQQIVSMLERECADAQVNTRTGVKVLAVARDGIFCVETTAGRFAAESLVVATGGLSIPKMGASGLGYELAGQFGLQVEACRPGLVPLVFDEDDRGRWCDLAGLSAEVTTKAGPSRPGARRRPAPAEFREKMLVTHRGLSGPAMLQVSSYWRPREKIEVDLAPGVEVLAPLLERNVRRDRAAVVSALRAVLPARMAERWVALQARDCGIHAARGQTGAAQAWTSAALACLEQEIHAWRIAPKETEGYAKAEVTVGGVSTAELEARTLVAKRVPGLYFIGEVVDVTGWLGGYNFQWAWASGVCAGRVA